MVRLSRILISIVIGCSCLMLMGCSKCSHGGKEKETIIPEGHSKPFIVEPIEGITISAAENALDKDREFKIKPVSEKTWKKSCKKVEEAAPWQTPILCFDLDAGMEPDEVMPGVFKVAIDLDKLGIPENLRDRMAVWRDGGDDMYEYTSWVENGQLCFNSDQNCPIILAIPVGIATLAGVIYGTETVQKRISALGMYEYFFFKHDDLVIHEVKDKNGDFILFFRFGDTEEADRFESYKLHADLYKTEYEKLKRQADEIYKRRVDKKYKKELGDMNFWQKLVGSTAAYNRAKEAVDHLFILDSLCKQDDDLQRYERNMALPPSIQDIEHYLKISNSYFTEYQKMKPQTKTIEVYLTSKDYTGGGNACIQNTKLQNPYMMVNYLMLWADNPQRTYSKIGLSEQLLLTLNHELYHHRQKITKSMDYRTMETTAPYNEYAAAWYFYKKGEMKTNLLAKDEKTKAFAEKYVTTSPRGRYDIFGKPFNHNSTDADVIYVYADFMDFIQREITHSDTTFLGCGTIVSLYHNIFSHKKNYMRWFSIDDEKVFDDYLRDFCFTNAGKIWLCQNSTLSDPAYKVQELEVTKDKPFAAVRTDKGELMMRSLYVSSGAGDSPIFNAFIVRDKGCSKDDVAFIGTWDDFAKDEKGNYKNTAIGDYFEGNKDIYWLGYFKVPNPSLRFTVVAYFQPDAPRIWRVKKDVLTYIIPKPVKALRRNRYITGAEITYTDKNGKTQTSVIALDDFGKKMKWEIPGCSGENSAFSLSYHYFYDLDDENTCVSPESEKTINGNMPETIKEEQLFKVDEKKGYWRQVSSRWTLEDNMVDGDISFEDESFKDHQMVMFMPEGDHEFDFTGYGSVAEDVDGTIVYLPETFLEGTVSYTKPPKQWAANTDYTCEWYTEKDPFLMRMDKPFTFTVENTTSAPQACEKKGNDNITQKTSSLGSMPWLHQAKTVFRTKQPGDNDPKAFSIVQKYTIVGYKGTDKKASIVLTYDYEWVEGEMESANLKEETSKDEPKEEPAQEDQENYLNIDRIDFSSKTLEPYGGQIGWTSFDRDGIHYFDIKDVTSTRSGAYQIVTMKVHQNTFDNDPQGYEYKDSKLDQDFTLTIKIAKDMTMEGSYHITRKSHAGAGQPAHPSTCNMSMSGTFGPLKATRYGSKYVFYQSQLPSFSFSVGGFLAYYWETNDIREFSYSTTSTNAEVGFTLYVK